MAARFLLLLVCACLGQLLWAQDDDEDAEVVQTLTWPESLGAQSYEVVVLDQAGLELVHTSLEVPTLQLKLGPGRYRYQVRVYNLLDQMEAESPWKDIEVLKAEIPRPRELRPSAIYLEDPVPRFRVSGSLLKEGAVVTLSRQDRPDLVATGRIVAHPSDSEFTVEFPDFEFTFGDYDLRVQNPGGLKHSLKAALQVRYSKPFDLRLAVGWAPVVPLFDPWYTTTWNRGFYPLGANGRLDVIFLKRSEDQAGLGFDGQISDLTGGIPAAAIQAFSAGGGGSLLYNMLLTKQIRAGVRLGGGLTATWYSFDYRGTSGVSWASMDPYASLEFDTSYWFNRWVYLEGGLGLSAGFNNGYVSGALKPTFLAGVAY